jgi:hypothetical protein
MIVRFVAVFVFALLVSQTHAGTSVPTQEFPFSYREGMLWVEVRLAKSSEALNFLLDSGAGVSVINLNTARLLGLRLANRVEVRGVDSVSSGYWPTRLSAHAGNMAMPKQYVALDLNNLSEACHGSVDGLLGADFFRDRIVQINFESQKVRLFKPGTAVSGGQVLPLKQNQNALLAPIKVNGRESQWLRVDTGCASALHWVRAGGSDDVRSHRIAVALKQVSLDMVPAQVTIGERELPPVFAEIHERPIFAGEDGLLGNGILAQFRSVTIDAPGGKIVFAGYR